ncbi:MAG: hypothetical protein HYU69_05465 [Bacteroidetes bacterium]|nr:hypothetical protein [Bacteroidota bacterium]
MNLTRITYYFTILVFPVVLFSSCKTGVTTAELEKYITDTGNGTKKSFEIGNFKAEIIYRPTDLMVNHELASGNKDAEALKNKYKKYDYFVLNMQNNGGDMLNSTASNKALFAGINEQLSFGMNEHVYIVDRNKDTTHLADFAFPRLYEAAKSTSILLAFKADAIKTDAFKICISDIGFTKGIIEFDFDKNDFKNIPSLKL